jgi:hypothetical protein
LSYGTALLNVSRFLPIHTALQARR